MEKSVAELMLFLKDCVVYPPESILRQALRQMIRRDDADREILDWQVLVMKGEEVVGVVTMREMADIVRPEYLVDPELRSQSVGTTCRFSNIFWNGLLR